ncbi:MAG TPA: type IV pilus biogenesis/stability protein PilW [Fontimonas sp.]
MTVMSRALLLVLVALVAACASSESRRESANVARVNTQLGISYAQRGQFPTALDKLKRALKADDSQSNTHAAIAYVYQNLGDMALAEKHYRRALRIDKEEPSLNNNFAVFLCERGRGPEAETYFLTAATNPQYATPEAAWSNAGRCLKDYDLDKAETYLREALKINPDAPDALGQMAVVSFRKGDYLRTRAFLQRYNLAKQSTPELLSLAALTEDALNNPEAAAAYRLRLKREFPESDEAVNNTPNSR